MISPISFPDQTGTLSGSFKNEAGVPIADLPVYRNETEIISCWRLGWLDVLRVVVSRNIWLRTLGAKQAPVCLQSENAFK
jgi:hypothetical protein